MAGSFVGSALIFSGGGCQWMAQVHQRWVLGPTTGGGGGWVQAPRAARIVERRVEGRDPRNSTEGQKKK
uniref:Secreted protein n=1 Tax=Knipowitschia caucasica TaxID=637954 RepID=A0AAV2MHZ2_KNICA